MIEVGHVGARDLNKPRPPPRFSHLPYHNITRLCSSTKASLASVMPEILLEQIQPPSDQAAPEGAPKEPEKKRSVVGIIYPPPEVRSILDTLNNIDTRTYIVYYVIYMRSLANWWPFNSKAVI